MRKYTSVILLVLVVILCSQTGGVESSTANPVTTTGPFQPQYTPNQYPQSSIDHLAELIGLNKFKQKYQTTGTGLTVALIDSGVDIGHPAFQNNPDGTAKISHYHDLTSEGKLNTTAVQACGQTVTYAEELYYIGNIPNTQPKYRMTKLSLPKIETSFAILVTAHQENYDYIYIDTNQNYDFTDEIPLTLYSHSKNFQTIIINNKKINLVLTQLEADGSELQLSTDTLGHGTFLAGILAANGKKYQGLAPNSQIAVYKIFDHEGQSSQYALAEAIEQAVADKVDLINLSLSIAADEQRLPRLEAALELAKQQQIPIVAAVGNYGPGIGSIAYPANDDYVIAIGSYQESKMMAQDVGIFLEETFIPSYSARANPEISEPNFFVAPAAVVSTVPCWYDEDYLYDEGTSISAAIVSGALLNLLQAIDIAPTELLLNLECWAKNLQYPAFEQGNGSFYLSVDLSNLSNFDSVKTTTSSQKQLRYLDLTNPQSIYFNIPQGQTATYCLEIPAGREKIKITTAILRQEPQNAQEHLIALGRCKVMLFDSEGKLVESPPSIGATFGAKTITSTELTATLNKAGNWQLTITSDPYLSQYNHLTTQGWLTITAE